MSDTLGRRCLCVLLYWLLPVFPVLALSTPVVRLTTADGLPSNVVHAIVEDRQGYLWFATGDGLARYDGTGFRLWRMEHGLADNTVRSLALDARDQLWIGTGNGVLQRLSADRQQFARGYRPPATTAGASPVLAIQPMDDGSVWFGTRDAGLFRLGRDRRLRQYLPSAGRDGLPSAQVEQLAADSHGGVWIGTAAGLARWHDDRFQSPAVLGASVLPVVALGLDAQGRLRSSTAERAELRRLPTWLPDPGHHRAARWLGPGRAGGSWFAAGAQLWWEDPHGHERYAVMLPPVLGHGPPRIERVIEDRQGRVWLLDSDQAVWRLGAHWRHLTHFAAPGVVSAAPGALAAAADGQAWWARGGTLSRVSPLHGFHGPRWTYAQDPTRTDRHAVVEDPQGVVWAFAAPWLTRIDPARERQQRWQVGEAGAGRQGMPAPAALLACDERLWLAGNGWVEQRAGDGSVLGRGTFDAVGLRPGGAAITLHCDAAGQVWLGDRDGLKQWRAAAGRFLSIPGGPRRQPGVWHFGNDGRLWRGDTDGWSAYWRDGARLHRTTHVGAAPGLPALQPRAVAETGDGAIWATTPRGLVRLAPDHRSARLYTVEDGLPMIVFESALVAAGGHLLATDVDGAVLAVDPVGMAAATRPALLVIDPVQVRRQGRRIELPASDPLRFNADDRDIQLSARLLGSGQGGATEYRFRLQGEDPAWIRAGRRGTHGFARLPAGEHVLEYQVRDVDGQWTPLQQRQVLVTYSGWAHPGAWALLGLGAAGATALLVWGLRRRHRRTVAWRATAGGQARAEQAAQAKARYLATLGHEVRTPLTGVLGMSELLLAGPLPTDAREQVLHIQQGGRALLQVVDEALEMARLQAGKVTLQQRCFAIGPWWLELRAAVAGALAPPCRVSIGPCLPASPCAVGDPDRLRQAMALLARGLATEVGATRLVLRIAWRPGRNGLLLDVLAEPGSGPSSRLPQVREALADADVLARAMEGQLHLLRRPDHRWQATLSVPMPCRGSIPCRPEATRSGGHVDMLRVLLVEDDPLSAEAIAGVLRRQGHTVVHAAHALAALTTLAGAGTQLVLLAPDLPGMDGLSLLRLLRQQDNCLPVLVLADSRDPDLAAQALVAGADGVLHIPLQAEDLHAAILQARRPRMDRAGAGNGLLCGALPDDRGGQV